MKNKNILIFALASLVLLLGQAWLTSRYQPPKPPQAVPVPGPAAEAPRAPAPTPTPVPTQAVERSVDSGRLHKVSLAELRLAFRVQDGALQQAEWLRDGTRFFPELDPSQGADTFTGIGGVPGSPFTGVREERESRDGKDYLLLHFEDGRGLRLSYRIPDRGHVLEASLTGASEPGAGLLLVRRVRESRKVQNPKNQEWVEVSPVAHLGRVISLPDTGAEAVAWNDVLTDPFFRFLGAKRKELPPAARRLGLDAGLEKSGASQSNHYFAALWDSEAPVQLAEAGYLASPQQGQARARLYLGPKEGDSLKAFGPVFTQVVDFGFFGKIAQFLFWFLKSIHAVFPNWGWAIIVFTVVIRLAMWPLNTKSTVQMLRTKDLEPHQKAIQAKYEKFGNDMAKKAEMQKELMAFYKKNGHNPLGGCLPMLLQMPFFLALWSMLNAVFELRHAPWIFWIQDLSAPDRFYVLPILLGLSMLAQQVATPAMGDPTQRKMMTWLMPGMMTFMFLNFAAGLNLYYLIFNLIGLLQTWWIKRSYVPAPVVA
ncbi:MAG: YidC/Oxa1 family insertase periplasmic-domain containing protein [Acidobacteria bacterium]|nr:YidC/Oxa1 family insertase periplasmic-domain containing protein [Acidobacteriota bacterium]